MNQIARIVLLLLLVISLAAPALAFFPEDTPAPAFSLADIDGNIVNLQDFKGKPVVLKLATTWCGACRTQTKDFSDYPDFFRENGITIVEIFVQDTEQMVRDYQDKHSYQFPHVMLLDDGSAKRSYQVFSIPRVLVLDGELKIRRDGLSMSAYDLKRKLQEILDEGSARK